MSRLKVPLSQPLVSVRVRSADPEAVQLTSAEQTPSSAAPADPGTAAVPAGRPSADELVELLESIDHAVLELEERRQQSLSELQQVAVDLAISAVSRILHDAFTADRVDVEQLIQRAIDDLPSDGSVTVSLNPEDLRGLRANLPDADEVLKERSVQFREEAQLGRGDYRIETSDGIWLSRIPDFLADLRRHLVEGLDDAQTERRQTEAAHRGMRRFPDRRDSA